MNKIWLYRAFKSEEDYKKGESYFHEVFDDHTRMKEFSAEFGKTAKQQYPDYVSSYEIYYKHGTIDPKEAEIPNVCFSLEDSDKPERQELFKQQRIERGFDDSETWSLVSTIAAFTIPRLEVFMRLSFDMIDWSDKDKEALRDIMVLLDLTTRDEGMWSFDEAEERQVKEGLKALTNYWFKLWW